VEISVVRVSSDHEIYPSAVSTEFGKKKKPKKNPNTYYFKTKNQTQQNLQQIQGDAC